MTLIVNLLYYPDMLYNHLAKRKKVKFEEYSFSVLFEPAEEGGYVVTCPALPGLVTEGDTLAEARKMAKDAIRAYLESLRKDGLPIPRDKKIKLVPVSTRLEVPFASSFPAGAVAKHR